MPRIAKPKTPPLSELRDYRRFVDSLLSKLSPKQRAFAEDRSRFTIVRTPRRAGKTVAVAAKMSARGCEKPKQNVVYFGLTRESAKEAIWQELIDQLKAANVPYEAKEFTLQIVLGNESRISLYGIDMDKMKDRFRGRRFDDVSIDECAFFGRIATVLNDVILPATSDSQAPVSISSSPGMTKAGLFYEADQGDQKDFWSHHTWTTHDNPHFQQAATAPGYATLAEQELDVMCKLRFGDDRTAPAFRREYLGEWVFDNRSLLYPLGLEHRIKESYPVRKEQFAIGLNLSVYGKQSFCVLKFSDYTRQVQVVETRKIECVNLTELAAEISEIREEYEVDGVYAYLGKNDPEILDDFKMRYNEPLVASRYEKDPFYLDIVSTDMQADNIEVVKDSVQLLKEFDALVKDETGQQVEDQSSLFADAFFAVYLNVYNAHLKMQDEEEKEDDRMERELRERCVEEYNELQEYYRDMY